MLELLFSLWYEFAPTMLALIAALLTSVAVWLMFGLLRSIFDPGSDTGIGVMSAFVSADILVFLNAVAAACFNLTWLFGSTPDGFERVIAFLLMVGTLLVAAPCLLLQRNARWAWQLADYRAWGRLTRDSLMLSFGVSTLHLIWLIKLPKWLVMI